jgi:L,D-transpeptidase catalytic domain
MKRTLGRVLAFAATIALTPATVAVAAGSATSTTTTTSGTSTTTTTTTSSTTTTTTTTPTPPPPKPKSGSATLYMFDAFFVHRQPVTVPDRLLHVDGVVRPYVPGQWVTVKSFLGHKLIKSDRLRIKPSRKHTYGRFTERIKSPGVGTVSVQVTHVRTAQMLGFKSKRSVDVLDKNVGFGSTGPFVDLIQQRLAALHLYIPQTGVYDSGTGLAIDAYHRLLRSGTSQSLDGRTTSFLLNGWGEFKVRFPQNGHHAEGNLGLQLLALADGSKVRYIFPISSGKPSTPTVLGNFRIYRRTPGYLPDGMYFSSFFIGGYAIHGFNPAPDFPASHGCMRLPIADAFFVYKWLTFNDWVDTYY